MSSALARRFFFSRWAFYPTGELEGVADHFFLPSTIIEAPHKAS